MGFQLGGAREQLSGQNGVIMDWIAQGVAMPLGCQHPILPRFGKLPRLFFEPKISTHDWHVAHDSPNPISKELSFVSLVNEWHAVP